MPSYFLSLSATRPNNLLSDCSSIMCLDEAWSLSWSHVFLQTACFVLQDVNYWPKVIDQCLIQACTRWGLAIYKVCLSPDWLIDDWPTIWLCKSHPTLITDMSLSRASFYTWMVVSRGLHFHLDFVVTPSTFVPIKVPVTPSVAYYVIDLLLSFHFFMKRFGPVIW